MVKVCEEGNSILGYYYENFRAPRGVALVRPYPVREIAKSRNQNREITKSRNHGIANSRNREVAESRIGIGNRNRKHATSARIGNYDLESEVAIRIGNRELEIGNRIANMPRQIRSCPSPSPIGIFLASILTRCDRESRVKGYVQ